MEENIFYPFGRKFLGLFAKFFQHYHTFHVFCNADFFCGETYIDGRGVFKQKTGLFSFYSVLDERILVTKVY